MYKEQLVALKKEGTKIRVEIAKHSAEARKLEKRLAAIGVEAKYLRALDAYQRKGRPLPKLQDEVQGRRPGRKPGKRAAGRRGGRGKQVPLTKLIPDVLSASGKPLSTNDLIEALKKKGWKTGATKAYPVVYNSAFILVRKGVLSKANDGKFSLK